VFVLSCLFGCLVVARLLSCLPSCLLCACHPACCAPAILPVVRLPSCLRSSALQSWFLQPHHLIPLHHFLLFSHLFPLLSFLLSFQRYTITCDKLTPSKSSNPNNILFFPISFIHHVGNNGSREKIHHALCPTNPINLLALIRKSIPLSVEILFSDHNIPGNFSQLPTAFTVPLLFCAIYTRNCSNL
jgi:hypothetical protein